MSDTPRTDAEPWINRYPEYHDGATQYVKADFARALERELAEARELAESWRMEVQIAEHRLAGKRHPRDNGIVAPDEIVTHLATVLRNIRSTWGGMVVTEDCKCDDCEFLRPIDAALTMVERREP
jgi:hypothetical protein